MYVQYGCGWSAPDGWHNFDGSPTLRFERIPVIGKLYTKNATRFPATVRYADVTAGLPIDSNSCDGVYASHILEHLSRNDIEVALKETLRILRPGGIFRLVVPDLEIAAREYITAIDAGATDAADKFVGTETMLGRRSRGKNLKGFIFEALNGSTHLWMWDYQSLAHLLSTHGFQDIRRARFNDSSDPAFLKVESESRFQKAVAIEAKKPFN